jgi:putative transposase
MKLKHYDHDCRARFITFSTHRDLPILTNNLFRGIIVQETVAICSHLKIQLLAYVVMPEHVHLVLVPPEELELGPTIGELKRAIAKRILSNIRENYSPLLDKLQVIRNGVRKTAVWKRRCYDHNCRTATAVWEKVRYCHFNPVKRGLVKEPGQWCWSSYQFYQEQSDLEEIDIAAKISCEPTRWVGYRNKH